MRTLFLLAALSLAGCGGDSDWDMVSKQDCPAPDGRRVATVFMMCDHSTTGDFAELSIRRPGEALGKRGNVFEGSPGETIAARWTSPTNLVVEHRAGGDLVAHPPERLQVAGVTVEFAVP
jgi:hypothetical protein